MSALVKDCGNAEKLQPFYVIMICSGIKFLMTILVFKMDLLKPAHKLQDEWKKTGCMVYMKGIMAICCQLAFMGMAVKTAVADFGSFWRDAEGSSIWQHYTCFGITWTTSVNHAASWSAFVALVPVCAVIEHQDEYGGYDPRPWGRIHAAKFYLKYAYGVLMVFGVLAPGYPCLITHAFPGTVMFACVSLYEFFKFGFFVLWRDMFTWNLPLLWADMLNLWAFAYPALLVTCLGGPLVSLIPQVICWWHDIPNDKLKPGPRAAADEESDRMVTAFEESAPPSDARPEIVRSGAEAMNKPRWSAPTFENPKQLGELTYVIVVMPVAMGLGVPIAARVYQGDGIYSAIQKTVTERSISQYMTVLRASIGGVQDSLSDRLSAACDAIWAIF